MLRLNQKESAEAAIAYYKGSFIKGDYYIQGSEIIGNWGGRGAALLGLSGPVQSAAYEALCNNLNPATQEQLTERMRSGRTVGWDLTFDVPKSVSVLHALTGDHRIMTAFREAVARTMDQIELDVQTRVRAGGVRDDNRTTGNLIWSEFIHLTTRPVDGVPDPQLHMHVFVFNATMDPVEKKWKAAQVRPVYDDAEYYQDAFHSHMRQLMREMGYSVTRRGLAFEVDGVPDAVSKTFSRRTAVIDRTAEAMGVSDDAEAKAKLGALTREAKNEDFTPDELRQIWLNKLSPEVQHQLRQVVEKSLMRAKAPELSGIPMPRHTEGITGMPGPDKPMTPVELTPDKQAAIDQAILHCFSTQSVVRQRELEAAVLRFGMDVLVWEVPALLRQHPDLIRMHEDGKTLITTRRVLTEEYLLVDWVRNRINTSRPVAAGHKIQDEKLGQDQRDAVMHLLRSTDRVTGVEGRAGTGKTTAMREAVKAAEDAGYKVMVLAPTSKMAREKLRNSGFPQADTLEMWLRNQRLRDKIGNDAIWWVDEAGLVSMPEMARLVGLADSMNARIWISGDTQQHRSVQRGDAMRVLKEKAGLELALLTEVRRQTGTYRDAVEAFAVGDVGLGFEYVQKMNSVHECGSMEECHQELAKKYVEARVDGHEPFVISPTHSEIRKVTKAMRDGLREVGKIRNEREAEILWPLHFSPAEVGDLLSYRSGLVVEFVDGDSSFKKGTRFTVTSVGRDSLGVQGADGQQVSFNPAHHVKAIQVFQPEQVALGVGDKIYITQNGRSADDKRKVTSGTFHTVKNFTKSGDIILDNDVVLGGNFKHFKYGYASTSYVAQGNDADMVLIAESPESFVAANRQQAYVDFSRGIEEVHLFTPDFAGVVDAAHKSSHRMAALDLVEDIEKQRELVAKEIAAVKNALGRATSPTHVKHINAPAEKAQVHVLPAEQVFGQISPAQLEGMAKTAKDHGMTLEQLIRLRPEFAARTPEAKQVGQPAKQPVKAKKPKEKDQDLELEL